MRQRVNGLNGIKTEGNPAGVIPKKPSSAVALKGHAGAGSSTTSDPISPTNTLQIRKTRKGVSGCFNSATVKMTCPAKTPNKKKKSSKVNKKQGRKTKPQSTSAGPSDTSYPPPDFGPLVFGRRTSAPSASKRTLQEPDGTAAMQIDSDSDERGEGGFSGCIPSSSRNSTAAREGQKRNSDACLEINNESKRSTCKKKGKEAKVDFFSSMSSTYWCSLDSPPASTSSYVTTTILNPEYHFPPHILEAVALIRTTLPVRRRKSSSYFRSQAGVYLSTTGLPHHA